MLTRMLIFCLAILVIGLALAAPAWASGSAPPTEGDDINPLSAAAVQRDLAIWTAVVFVVLALVMSKFAWKPLTDGLDRRERHVSDQIAQAEEANRQAKELLAGYDKKLADARDEVRVLIEQGRRDAEQVGRKMLDKAKEEVQAEQKEAAARIEAATDAAVKELADRSALLAVELAGKIVRGKLTAGDHTQLIEQAVAGFVQGRGDVNRVSRN